MRYLDIWSFHEGENVDWGLLSYDDMYLGGYQRLCGTTSETFVNHPEDYMVS
jgi:hypothetical protein